MCVLLNANDRCGVNGVSTKPNPLSHRGSLNNIMNQILHSLSSLSAFISLWVGILLHQFHGVLGATVLITHCNIFQGLLRLQVQIVFCKFVIKKSSRIKEREMEKMTGYQMGVIGALFLSVASSVSIVICNKALMSNLGFPFATTLTSWHLMVTYCTLHVAQRLNFFESKPIDMKTVIFFGILNGISIGFLNLSLGFNSVGFYQMTKLAIIPFTVLLETLFLHKQFSQKIKFSLLVLLVGVGIASVTDLQLNLVGTILSLLAIITTCVGQILTNTIQKRLNVSSTQLLYQSAPFQAAILFVSGPLLDQWLTEQNVFAYSYSPIVLAFIVLSCLIAVSVNFSTFLVIGKTSPVTYQVLGHLKTCLVLGFGYTLLHDPFTSRNIVGILVAIVGMGLYSYFCTLENKKKSSNDLSPLIKDKDTTNTPLLSGKNQEKEGHEVKKSTKDSLV